MLGDVFASHVGLCATQMKLCPHAHVVRARKLDQRVTLGEVEVAARHGLGRLELEAFSAVTRLSSRQGRRVIMHVGRADPLALGLAAGEVAVVDRGANEEARVRQLAERRGAGGACSIGGRRPGSARVGGLDQRGPSRGAALDGHLGHELGRVLRHLRLPFHPRLLFRPRRLRRLWLGGVRPWADLGLCEMGAPCAGVGGCRRRRRRSAGRSRCPRARRWRFRGRRSSCPARRSPPTKRC